MRILMIRHGDPDYSIDSLTETGRKEAMALAETADRLHVGTCYVSPLGRAALTAKYTLDRLHLTGETLDWLQEFPARVDLNASAGLSAAYGNPETENGHFLPEIPWDLLPSYYTAHPEYADAAAWRTSEIAVHSDTVQQYDAVIAAFDRLLASYGYVREEQHYHVRQETAETITFFCHFGISCVLLSHLFNVSPFVLWHSLAMAPSSVTEVVSEERVRGTASFRALKIGSVSHLERKGMEPSFAARFCEIYSDKSKRH